MALTAFLIFMAIGLAACPPNHDAPARTDHNYYVFSLGGQSNMGGDGYNSQRPDDMQSPNIFVDGLVAISCYKTRLG